MSPIDIRLTGVQVRRDGRPVLAGIDACLPAGAVTAFVGDNGSGKSTLLEALAGVLPWSGTIDHLPASRALVVQRTEAGDRLPLTARAAVEMGRWRDLGRRRLTTGDHAVVDDAMEALGVSHLQRRQLSTLSGGERQRVFVAQGLAQDAPLTLLDEPTSAADTGSRDRVDSALRRLADRGRTVVVATHDRTTLARADHAVLLERGRVVVAGTPHEVAEVQAQRAAEALLLR